MYNWCLCWFLTHIFIGDFNFKGLTARHLYKSFGVKGLILFYGSAGSMRGSALRLLTKARVRTQANQCGICFAETGFAGFLLLRLYILRNEHLRYVTHLTLLYGNRYPCYMTLSIVLYINISVP
jgi:hypothetical protein